MSTIRLLHDGESWPGAVVDEFATWCEDSVLELKISKTKDIINDSYTHAKIQEPTNIRIHWVFAVILFGFLVN